MGAFKWLRAKVINIFRLGCSIRGPCIEKWKVSFHEINNKKIKYQENISSVLHHFDQKSLNKDWAAIFLPCIIPPPSKLLTSQLCSDTEMKSWGGVSLDPGSGGHWLKNRSLGRKMCSGAVSRSHTPKDVGTQWEITELSLFLFFSRVHLPPRSVLSVCHLA